MSQQIEMPLDRDTEIILCRSAIARSTEVVNFYSHIWNLQGEMFIIAMKDTGGRTHQFTLHTDSQLAIGKKMIEDLMAHENYKRATQQQRLSELLSQAINEPAND